MSPELAKVFVVEDSLVWLGLIKRRLEIDGHEITLISKSLEEALEAVGNLTELGIQVAMLDENLSEDDRSGNDGRTILKAIKVKAPAVKTIGFSFREMEGVDLDLGKGKIEKLGKVITEI